MKEKGRWLGIKLCMIQIGMFYMISGCSDTQLKEQPAEETVIDNRVITANSLENAEEITDICLDLYEKAEKENRMADLEMIRSIIERLGENGYTAVDSKNQINMTGPEKVIRFCERANARETAELTIIEVTYEGSFVKYDFQTQNGGVNVDRSYYKYKKGNILKQFSCNYPAEYWKYTEEGYFMFAGTWFSEEQYILTSSVEEEQIAFRVQPLDETYRELNRKYLLPIGYKQNNMFLENWSEDDFGNLNFYDLYDILYEKVNAEHMPYVADDNLAEGTVYRIPKDEFERVIMAYFRIDSMTLQSKTTYNSGDATYEYKPRGFYEMEYPEYPYSEVVGFTENSDGTITLMVNVVSPYTGDSKVYVHEVIIRPLEDGIQYVSNRMISPKEGFEETWHVPRLTKEEWEEIYGENEDDSRRVAEDTSVATSPESAYCFIPQAGECLISEDEKEQLKKEVLSAAESVSKIYKDAGSVDAPMLSSGISDFTGEQRKAVVEELGKLGLVSVEEDTDMQNHEAMEIFYANYLNGQDSTVTVFEVQRDGLIGAVTFIYRDRELQTYYIGIRWKEGGVPEIQGTSVSNVDEIKLTEKGYFIYAYETLIAHGGLRQYWRIKPLSKECRELTKKYISGLSYVNYNMLVTNWDSSNVEDILMPCMFEDIYYIYTGEILKTENRQIPAEEYEKIMTTCFPVSVEQLREHGKYDEENNSYEYEMIYASPYPPFGEVIDYTENADGTITLIVDGVWPDYNSDLAFRNTVVVQPFEDGTFRYLSNSIEQKELELPPIAGTQ